MSVGLLLGAILDTFQLLDTLDEFFQPAMSSSDFATTFTRLLKRLDSSAQLTSKVQNKDSILKATVCHSILANHVYDKDVAQPLCLRDCMEALVSFLERKNSALLQRVQRRVQLLDYDLIEDTGRKKSKRLHHSGLQGREIQTRILCSVLIEPLSASQIFMDQVAQMPPSDQKTIHLSLSEGLFWEKLELEWTCYETRRHNQELCNTVRELEQATSQLKVRTGNLQQLLDVKENDRSHLEHDIFLLEAKYNDQQCEFRKAVKRLSTLEKRYRAVVDENKDLAKELEVYQKLSPITDDSGEVTEYYDKCSQKHAPWGSEAAEQGAAEQGATEESVAAEALALEVKSLKWENNILSTWIYQTGI